MGVVETSVSAGDDPESYVESNRNRALRRWRNWAAVRSCVPAYWHRPRSVEEVRAVLTIAAQRGERVRVAGTGHSPNDMVATDGHLVSMERLNGVLELDVEARTVRVEAGATLAQVSEVLAQAGLALENLGSIDAQQVGGVLATATHGTGAQFGIVATSVLAFELMVASGDVLFCSREENRDVFLAGLTHLGCLGVVLTVTIQAVPAFALDSREEAMQLDAALETVEEIAAFDGHSKMHWYPHTDTVIVTRSTRHEGKKLRPKAATARSWLVNEVLRHGVLETALYGARFVPRLVPSINRAYAALARANCGQERGPSYEVFRMDCLFKQYVTEWAIPRDQCATALRELRGLIERDGLKVHFPVEVRFVKGDDIWLSTAYGRDTCFIGIIMYRPFGASIAYKRYFAAFERIMQALGGRPHWAKVFAVDREDLRAMYPKWDDFWRVQARLDPERMFWNEYVERLQQ